MFKSYTTYLSFLDDSRDLSTWERGAPAPQCLSELLGRQSGARAPRSRERRTSFLQDLVLNKLCYPVSLLIRWREYGASAAEQRLREPLSWSDLPIESDDVRAVSIAAEWKF